MKAVLFDLDGVIVNSEWANVEASVRAFRDLGIKLSEKDKKNIIGRHPVDYGKIFLKKYSFDYPKFLKLQPPYYDRLYKRSTLFPNVKKLILDLKKQGFLLALVTSAPLKTVKRALKKFSLAKIFDTFVTFENSTRRKPAPDAYLLAAKRLNVKNSECVVIEDSIPGVAAAKNAKMACIAVTNSFPASKLKKADLIVNSLKDKRIKELLC